MFTPTIRKRVWNSLFSDSLSERSRSAAGRRRGMTLIEILVSIGVLAVGLTGVAILLPVAHHQAREGVLEDRKASAGQRAFREFHIRGMANPENWVGDIVNQVAGPRVLHRRAYCLDPLGMSAGLTPEPHNFPVQAVTPGPIPSMIRITLAAKPGYGTLGAMQVGGTHLPMTALQASQIVTVEDDLVFELPDDEVLPAQQKWLPDANNQVKRVAEGRFSWFATLVPDLTSASSDGYRLSLAITVQRRPELDVLAERPVRVTFLGQQQGAPFFAYAGGDVQLTDNDNQPIDVRVGQWLLLGQPAGTDAFNDPQFDFRWYRVTAADEREGQPLRELTLQGPDWWIPANTPTSAALVPGVVAVYEKTIRLETSTLWTTPRRMLQ